MLPKSSPNASRESRCASRCFGPSRSLRNSLMRASRLKPPDRKVSVSKRCASAINSSWARTGGFEFGGTVGHGSCSPQQRWIGRHCFRRCAPRSWIAHWHSWTKASRNFAPPPYMPIQSAAPALKGPQRRPAPVNGCAAFPLPLGRPLKGQSPAHDPLMSRRHLPSQAWLARKATRTATAN